MNAINPWGGQSRVFMRSLATREAGSEISQALPDVIAACKVAGFDLVIVETSGIGQGDAAIVPHVDVSMYVMTPEFGAASQLEKSTCWISPISWRSTNSTAKARRMPARRRQTIPAQPRNVEQKTGRDAGLWHAGIAL
jgi:septum formation inhibitor-activating ATPase MinD